VLDTSVKFKTCIAFLSDVIAHYMSDEHYAAL